MPLAFYILKRGILTMKKNVVILLMFAFCFNQGCCSIFTSDPQPITIKSTHKGANVKIGPYKGKTPYTVIMPRGEQYIIEGKIGDKTETVALNRSIEPVYWVNILFWPGLIIDFATGSMWKYQPTEYELTFD
jgi:hypothetical protein